MGPKHMTLKYSLLTAKMAELAQMCLFLPSSLPTKKVTSHNSGSSLNNKGF